MGEVKRVKLGSQGLEVSALGLGCMGMSFGYGPPKPEPDMIKLIHHAIDNGVTYLDTANVYGPFLNEKLLAKALKGGMREKVQVASKVGMENAYSLQPEEIHGEPEYLRAACEDSLKRLEIDYIDLYYLHRIDQKIPIEITMGEMKKLVEEGKIKYVGLSEASPETIRRAHAVHPITAVQLEWSFWTRDGEEEIVPTCRELGIGIVAFTPLGRGFFAIGPKCTEDLASNDIRKFLPRYQGANLEHNKNLYDLVKEMATKKGCTPAQLTLAWLQHHGDDVVPIPGSTKIEQFNENIGALSVQLTPEDIAYLGAIASVDAVKGDRLPSMAISWMNANTPPLDSWKA